MRLLKQDIDLINCFTDGEVKEVLRQPNQRDYVGFRDYVAMILLLDSRIRVKAYSLEKNALDKRFT